MNYTTTDEWPWRGESNMEMEWVKKWSVGL